MSEDPSVGVGPATPSPGNPPALAAEGAPEPAPGAGVELAPSPRIGPEPGRGVDPDWLSARRRADTAARAATVETLLPLLVEHLRDRTIDALQVVDLGAGRGANQRWLRPRLPFDQHWTHVDHDSEILHRDRLPDTTYVSAEVGDLPRVIARLTAGPVLVTCSALLDVLPRAALDRLCDDLVAARVPALFSLSVTGELTIDPEHPDDQMLLAGFNAHQRRDGRAGPDAPRLAAERLDRAGAVVHAAETPWQLDPSADPAFVDQFLRERVEAAVEHDPGLAGAGAQWLAARRAIHRQGRLRMVVGHRDLLVLPS